MSSEAVQQEGQTPPIKRSGWPMFFCPISQIKDAGEIARIRMECKQESFWYREYRKGFQHFIGAADITSAAVSRGDIRIMEALPLSLGSMLVTQGLISKGVFSASPRFGPYPKMAIAGILGFAIGKISYFGECQRKFERIGMTPFGPQQKRRCHHACKECKAKLGPNEKEGSIPSVS